MYIEHAFNENTYIENCLEYFETATKEEMINLYADSITLFMETWKHFEKEFPKETTKFSNQIKYFNPIYQEMRHFDRDIQIRTRWKSLKNPIDDPSKIIFKERLASCGNE